MRLSNNIHFAPRCQELKYRVIAWIPAVLLTAFLFLFLHLQLNNTIRGTHAGPLTEAPSPTPSAQSFLPFISSAYPSPFFFKNDYSPIYLQNFANDAGCNWMGVAGEVLDLNGQPVGDDLYRVHVWGSGIDAVVPVGEAPAYGPSGWEQFLFDSPVVRDYTLQLLLMDNTPVSPIYDFQTRASCNENLVLFNFVQVQ